MRVRDPRHLESLLFQALVDLSTEQARLWQPTSRPRASPGGTTIDLSANAPETAMTPPAAPLFSVPGPVEGVVERLGILEQLVASCHSTKPEAGGDHHWRRRSGRVREDHSGENARKP